MTKIQERLEKALEDLQIDELAKQTRFDIRDSGTITGKNFLLGGFKMLQNCNKISLNNWAASIGFVAEKSVNKQAVDQKFYARHLSFIKSVVTQSLKRNFTRLEEQVSEEKRSELFADFNRVLVRDSVCFKLHPSLAEAFPSSHQKNGENKATARAQVGFDMKGKDFLDFDLGSFRDNDGKAAPRILDYAQEGDLALQDLGYLAFEVYQALNEKGVYFATRYRFNTKIFEEDSHQPIDLLKELKEKGSYDGFVLMGVKQKVRVRVVATRLPKKVAQERKRKARENRHSKSNHNDDYYKMLEWHIVVTNVPPHIWTAKQVAKAYQVRWHIEIIFKAWKSHLNFDQKISHKMSENKCRAIFYLMFLYVVLIFAKLHKQLYSQIREKYGGKKQLSLFSFYEFVQNFKEDILEKTEAFIVEMVITHCCYDKRTDRQNHEQLYYFK